MLLGNSPGEFAAKLAAAAYQVPSGRWHRAKNTAAEFVHRLRVTPTVTLGPDGYPTFGFSGDLSAPSLAPVLEDVYALLSEAATKRPAVLVLDEFQAITDLGAHLPGTLKALSDQYGRVSLVIAGSQTHLMERLTGSTGAPLYGMAERISLGPVGPTDMASYLARRAKVGRKPMAVNVAEEIIAMGGPIPNDIQRLAYSAYQMADDGIGTEDVQRGMVETVAHDASTYAKIYASFTTGQRRVLRALAGGSSTEIFSARFARSVQLANASSVKRVINALSADETITSPEGRWVVTDPFFAFWLREPGAEDILYYR